MLKNKIATRSLERAPSPRRAGSLVIVGTGISIGHMTVESRAHIKNAKRIVALVADPVTYAWLLQCNSRTESLARFYAKEKPRRQTYSEIVQYVFSLLLKNEDVCFVLYGHPGVFAIPPHELIRLARKEGIPARMLAGVSTEDCLFVDFGVDPATSGCQSFETTDFLLHNRVHDPCSALILWQFGMIGQCACRVKFRRDFVKELERRLLLHYPPDHIVYVYEAAVYPFVKPLCRGVPLNRLTRSRHVPMSTLFVPALPDRPDDSNISQLLKAG